MNIHAVLILTLERLTADTLPDLIANGETAADWVYVRTTQNHYSNAPVSRLSTLHRSTPPVLIAPPLCVPVHR